MPIGLDGVSPGRLPAYARDVRDELAIKAASRTHRVGGCRGGAA